MQKLKPPVIKKISPRVKTKIIECVFYKGNKPIRMNFWINKENKIKS